MARRRPRWAWVFTLLVVFVVIAIVSDDDDDPRRVNAPASNSVLRAPPVQIPEPQNSVAQLPSVTRLYVVTDVLNVRATPETGGKLLGQISRGTEVIVSHQSGEWYGATLEDGTVAWVHGDYLAASRPTEAVATRPATPSQSAALFDRDQIVQAIIQRSLAGYSGNCPCPYNRMRNGRSCGGNSAYSKPGGASPLCYPTDVTQAMIDRYVAQ
jgi:hypothetical protein